MSSSNKTIQDLVKSNENQVLAEEMVSIYDPEREMFVFSTDFLREGFHKTLLNSIDTNKSINNITKRDTKATIVKVKKYWVIVSAKDVLEKEALKDLRDILVILCLVALLFIAYISWYMADKAISPILRISKQLDVIFPKNLSRRVEYANIMDELGGLTKTINELLERVEVTVNTQKMFVANISHELKNPLTTIFTQIEILEMRYRDNPQFHKEILSLRSDTLQLNQLTQTILELANTYTKESDLPKRICRIDEILLSSIADFKRWNPDFDVKLNLDNFPEEESTLEYLANEDALKIVFKNLIDNACKFSDNDSVEISLYAEDSVLYISIYNQGAPIPITEVSKIIQPFFRSDATAKGKKGHGVGLAIVQQILILHGITLSINSSTTGNYFILQFRK